MEELKKIVQSYLYEKYGDDWLMYSVRPHPVTRKLKIFVFLNDGIVQIEDFIITSVKCNFKAKHGSDSELMYDETRMLIDLRRINYTYEDLNELVETEAGGTDLNHCTFVFKKGDKKYKITWFDLNERELYYKDYKEEE